MFIHTPRRVVNSNLRFFIWGLGSRVLGFGFRVESFGFRVDDGRSEDSGASLEPTVKTLPGPATFLLQRFSHLKAPETTKISMLIV